MNELVARLAMKAAMRIMHDLGERSGIGDELEQIDSDVLVEIMSEIAAACAGMADELLAELGVGTSE